MRVDRPPSWLGLVVALAMGARPALAQTAPGQPASPAQPRQTAAELVARYLAWRGGAAYASLTTLHETEVVAGPTGPQRREIWQDRDGRTRVATDFGFAGMHTIAVSGPAGGWSTTISGQVIDSPDDVESGRRYALVAFGGALRGQGGAKIELGGIAKVENRPWPVVRVTFGDADEYDLVIDPESGRLCCYRIDERGVERLELFGDWRAVDGVQMPFKQQEVTHFGRTASTLEVVALNGRFDPGLFERPAAARLAAFAPGASSSGWVDVDFSGVAPIYLPVRVNGRPATAVLDSGASLTAIDASYARSISLAPQGSSQVAGVEDVSKTAFVPGVAIDVGKLQLRGLTVAALDLGAASKLAGRPLPVILGQEPFNELVVDVDFPNHRVRFVDPRRFVPPAGAVAIPLSPKGAALSVEGRPPALFMVDLGDTSALDLYPDFVAAAKLGVGRTAAPMMSFGLGGFEVDQAASLREVTFGGVRFGNVPAHFQRQSQPGVGSDVAGRAGLGVLSRFRALFDYPQGRLFLVASPGAASRPFEKDRMGLGLVPDGGDLVVKLVDAGSPAEAAGFKVGDRVTRIDGRPVGAWSVFQRDEAFSRSPGTTVRLTLAGGESRTVILRDYF